MAQKGLEMHLNFPDWYQPVTFGHDRGTIALRWAGIEGFLKEATTSAMLDLVRFVFFLRTSTNDTLSEVRGQFNAADPTFKTAGNDQELRILAGSILASVCLDMNSEHGEIIALAILTTSACQSRKLELSFDLIGMAIARVKFDAINARKRPQFEKLKIFTHKEAFEKAGTQLLLAWNANGAAEAIKSVGSATEALVDSVQQAVRIKFDQIHALLEIQDEELQLVWWLVGGWSFMWGCNFKDIPAKARPILLSFEAARMTVLTTEMPSLNAIFLRLGIGQNLRLSIPIAVNSCSADHLKNLAPKKSPCPFLFPLTNAIFRASETAGGKTWIDAWENTASVQNSSQIDSLELAIQFYREQKLGVLTEELDE